MTEPNNKRPYDVETPAPPLIHDRNFMRGVRNAVLFFVVMLLVIFGIWWGFL